MRDYTAESKYVRTTEPKEPVESTQPNLTHLQSPLKVTHVHDLSIETSKSQRSLIPLQTRWKWNFIQSMNGFEHDICPGQSKNNTVKLLQLPHSSSLSAAKK